MSGYLSSLVTNTTSRYNTLRRTLLSDEADGDTEDDSHISRVLRAYYTEKGRGLPQWLPPDPKRPGLVSAASGSFSSSLRQQPPQTHAAQSGQRGGLSELWDAPSQLASAQQQPLSLRRQAQERNTVQGRGQETLQPGLAQSLPGQRAGSYQSQRQGSDASSAGAGAGAGGGTAQDRLKARLWGAARSASPALGGGTASDVGRNPYEHQQAYDGQGGGGRGYEESGGGYGGRDRMGAPNGPRPR